MIGQLQLFHSWTQSSSFISSDDKFQIHGLYSSYTNVELRL